jgi:membrane associated rhomboid family serine protease
MLPVTTFLILINVAVFVAQQFFWDPLIAHLALWPLGDFPLPGLDSSVGFEPWQLVTSAFLHGNFQHIAFNMLALFMFGRGIEQYLGRTRYLALYFAAVLSAGVTQLIVVSTGPDVMPVPTLGASGGVFGILLAFGWLFPRSRVTLLCPPIPMPAWLFVTLYGLVELGSGVFGTWSGVAHFAHLGGMIGAFIVLQFWRRPRVVL